MQELKEFSDYQPIAFQRHKIDVYLNRHEKALLNLLECHDQYDFAIKYAKEHKVMEELVRHIGFNHEYTNIVYEVYAEWLEEQGLYEDAAMAYIICHFENKAIDAYRLFLI